MYCFVFFVSHLFHYALMETREKKKTEREEMQTPGLIYQSFSTVLCTYVYISRTEIQKR